MSKSLEALEVIECILSNHQTMLEAKDKRFEFINTIKQDLERSEELEKENEDLKVFVDAYANARDELLIRNQKLEKAIEIIKNHDIRPINHLGTLRFAYNEFNSTLTQQEYELLKEILN